jgi:hypothetical protein
MTSDQRTVDVAGPARLVPWAVLVVSIGGVTLFGSVVAGVGDWMEGRELQTVGAWAIPALLLAATALAVAIHAVRTGRGQRMTTLLGLAVITSMVMLFILNPSTAPPVA